MDTVGMKLLDYGFAGVLMACIITYTWWVITKVLPKQQQGHVDDLKRVHKNCEEELRRVSDDYRESTEKQRASHLKLVEKMCDKLENVDKTLVHLLNRLQEGSASCRKPTT